MILLLGTVPGHSLLIAFPFEQGCERFALNLVSSLRRCGGELADLPVVVFVPEGAAGPLPAGRARLEVRGAKIVSYSRDAALDKVPLGSKADAASAAERHASERGFSGLAWLDLDTLILREPTEFLLPEGTDLAFRPVHHRLIGSRCEEPPDPFWAAVYEHCGVAVEQAFPVLSTVDREWIRFYPNAGCLVVRPQAGILQAWRVMLRKAPAHAAIQREIQGDGRRSLFLHQAVLAGAILSRVPEAAMRELSFAYNYPLHLHRKVPLALRPRGMEDLVTLRFESFGVLEDSELPLAERVREVLQEE